MKKKNNNQFVNMFENFTIEDLRKLKKGLDDYNNKSNELILITAPKFIKLSEIVSKFIQPNYLYNNWKINVIRNIDEIHIYEEYDIEIGEDTLGQCSLLVLIKDTKLIEINISDRQEDLNKWLYTLWIAGTTIIDDWEGQDE